MLLFVLRFAASCCDRSPSRRSQVDCSTSRPEADEGMVAARWKVARSRPKIDLRSTQWYDRGRRLDPVVGRGARWMAARNEHSSGGSAGFKWEASEWPIFLHLDIFDEEWEALGLGVDDLQELQSAILASPAITSIVRGTEGLRKIRFAPSRERAARRGAYRVGYVRFPEFGFILLVTVWGKNDKSDLSARTEKPSPRSSGTSEGH